MEHIAKELQGSPYREEPGRVSWSWEGQEVIYLPLSRFSASQGTEPATWADVWPCLERTSATKTIEQSVTDFKSVCTNPLFFVSSKLLHPAAGSPAQERKSVSGICSQVKPSRGRCKMARGRSMPQHSPGTPITPSAKACPLQPTPNKKNRCLSETIGCARAAGSCWSWPVVLVARPLIGLILKQDDGKPGAGGLEW